MLCLVYSFDTELESRSFTFSYGTLIHESKIHFALKTAVSHHTCPSSIKASLRKFGVIMLKFGVKEISKCTFCKRGVNQRLVGCRTLRCPYVHKSWMQEKKMLLMGHKLMYFLSASSFISTCHASSFLSSHIPVDKSTMFRALENHIRQQNTLIVKSSM